MHMPAPHRTFLRQAGEFLVAHRLAIAVALVTVQSLLALLQASAIIDGTWYFWLDDDQMISMRYARNLREGHGLLWNPGAPPVEGYTNFLWTILLAALHCLPLSAAKMAASVVALNWILLLSLLAAVDRLQSALELRPPVALAGLAILGLNLDIVYWAVHGFETTLLTTVFVCVVCSSLQRKRTSGMPTVAFVGLATLPLIRSDALYVWLAAAIIVLGTAHRRSRTAVMILLSLLPLAGHLLWRHSYYGDWLPNTYYLRVAGLSDRLPLAADYLHRFAAHYGLALLVAIAGCLARRDRRRWLLLTPVVIAAVYVLMVGEDLFTHSRFLAHTIPPLIVVAGAAIGDLHAGDSAYFKQAAALTLLVFAALQTWLIGTTSLAALRDDNGKPLENTVAAVLIERHTAPQAKVAVLAAGNVPYFSRRPAIDLLGKSDKVIARLPPHPEGYVAHNKYDPELSLRERPDLVVSFWLYKWAIDDWTIEQARAGGDAWITALITSPTFRGEYLPTPVPVAYLLDNNAVYVWQKSPERLRLRQWHQPTVVESAGWNLR